MKCMAPKCEEDAHHRGLCMRCYRAAARMVRLHRTSWKELIQKKLALPAQGRSKTPLAEYLEAMEEKEFGPSRDLP
jgi:hypothetical protein